MTIDNFDCSRQIPSAAERDCVDVFAAAAVACPIVYPSKHCVHRSKGQSEAVLARVDALLEKLGDSDTLFSELTRPSESSDTSVSHRGDVLTPKLLFFMASYFTGR